MRLIPAFDTVVVVLQQKEQVSPGGIILPDNAQEKPLVGVIESIGPGALNTTTGEFVPTTFKVGKKVMFKRWAGGEFPGDKTRWIIHETDILGEVVD